MVTDVFSRKKAFSERIDGRERHRRCYLGLFPAIRQENEHHGASFPAVVGVNKSQKRIFHEFEKICCILKWICDIIFLNLKAGEEKIE